MQRTVFFVVQGVMVVNSSLRGFFPLALICLQRLWTWHSFDYSRLHLFFVREAERVYAGRVAFVAEAGIFCPLGLLGRDYLVTDVFQGNV